MKLDDIDKQIINILFQNGRQSLTELGTKVQKSNEESMSHTGVNKRISKLEKKGILKVQGNINIQSLEYNACFILMEMRSYEYIKKIINAYLECPRVFLLSQVNGRYNLIMGILGRDIEVLHRFINYCGPTNKDGVLHSDVLFVSEFKVPEYIPSNLFTPESRECDCGNICKNCEAFLARECDGCGNF